MRNLFAVAALLATLSTAPALDNAPAVRLANAPPVAPGRDCTACPGNGDYCDCWSNIPNGTCGHCTGGKLDLPPVPPMRPPVPPPSGPEPLLITGQNAGVRVCDANGCRLVPNATQTRVATPAVVSGPVESGVVVGSAAPRGGRFATRMSKPFLERTGPLRAVVRLFGRRCNCE